MKTLRRILPVFLISSFILLECLSVASAAKFTVFKKTYIRDTSKPVAETDSFTALSTKTTYLLRAINGSDTDPAVEQVSSALSFLNDSQILFPKEFNQKMTLIEKQVTLKTANSISTEVRSIPGGQLTLEIIGSDDQPPTVTWLAPQESALFETPPIPSELKLSDDNSGIDPSTLNILLDNNSVRDSFTPLAAPTLDTTLNSNLNASHGRHTLTAQVKDVAGNLAQASVSFTINKKPIASAGADHDSFVNTVVTLDGSRSSDPDNDPLTYKWSFISRPGNSAAALSGAATVNPSFVPDLAGSYVIELIVNDGAIDSAPAGVTIAAINQGPPAPVTTPQSGFIDGQVFDAKTESPLENVEVSVSGVTGTVFTDSQGKFSFPTPGTGEFGLTFKGEGYIFSRRKVSVVSTRDAWVELVFLMPVDTQITTITNAGGTHIDSTGKVEITIPPNALPAGTESIEVQATLYEHSTELPAPLPETSFYTYALDIKPDGINFTRPVSGKLANELGFAPGTQIPIGYYNSRTLKWEDTGLKGTVSADGRWVEFQITHFSPYDINLPPLPPPIGDYPPVYENNTKNNDSKDKNCAKDKGNSLILLKSGELILDHNLPSIKTLNYEHSLSFVYNSLNANPTSLISVDTNLDPNFTNIPATTTFKLNIEGRAIKAPYIGTSGKARHSYLYDCINGQGKKLPTGSYPYTVEISNDYTNATYGTADYFGGPPTGDTVVPVREPFSLTTTVKDRIPVNNQQNSPFGSGWGLTELQRLYFDPNGSILLTEGDGSAKIFKKQATTVQDLVITDWNSDNIIVFTGNGDGTFSNRKTYSVGDRPYAMAVGDFNKDAIPDLVVANVYSDNISVLIGNEDGTFQNQTTYYIGMWARPQSVTIGDFNQDTFQDLAVPDWLYGTVSILLGNGDGTFKNPIKYPAGEYPHSVIIGDFNQDTFQDLAVSNREVNSISILLGNGDGTFKNPIKYPAGTYVRSIASGDFNRDGFTDLAVVNVFSNNISIFLGNGDGTFQNQVTYATGKGPVDIKIGDFNRDTFSDLIITNSNSNNISIFLGNGDGTFQNQVTYATGKGPVGISIGDFNLDGPQDLVISNYYDNNISIFFGQGDGTFQSQVIFAVTDGIIDQEGGSDIIGVNLSHAIYPEGAFIPPQGEYSYVIQNSDKTYTRFLKDGTRVIFNEDGFHTQTIDKNGNTLTYDYTDLNGAGKKDALSSIALPAGAKYQFSYDSQGKLSSITDPAGRVTGFSIDAQGDLTQITNPDGTSKAYTYDGNHLITKKTDERGFSAEYFYDQYGAINIVLSPEREVTEVAADGTIAQTRKKEPRLYFPSDVKGLVNGPLILCGTPFINNPIPVVRPEDITAELIDGKINKWTYRTNKFGGRLQFIDPLNNTTTYERDGNSNLIKLIRANGSVVRMTYESKGDLYSVKEDYNSAVTRLTYEPNFNQPTSIKDPEGNLTAIDYDPHGNPIQITDAQSDIAKIEFNPKGQPTKVIQASGTNIQNETNFAYDPTTFNLLSITDPLGKPTSFTYDAAGNIKTVTDAEGKITVYSYDLMNRITSVTDADNKTTTYAYDPSGNLISVTDANDHTTTFAYDEQGQLIKTTNALNQQKQFFYDVNRNLSLMITPNGDNIKFYYNKANIPEKKFTPSDTVNYAYDRTYNLTDTSDSDSSLTFAYDPIGRLTQAVTKPGFLQPQTSITYTYDLNNNRTSLTNPQGIITKYIYDSLNRLTDIKDQQDNALSYFEYDRLGRRINKSIPVTQSSQLITNYTYDPASRLLSIVHEPLSLAYSYTYDYAGNRTKVIARSPLQADDEAIYSYDNLYRLTKATHPNIPQESYSYDPVGNRTKVIASPQGEAIYTYDAANRLLDDGTYAYTYDNNGNMIEKTNKTDGTITAYNYDPEDRLVIARSPQSDEAIYSYDPLGRRIQKSVNGAITKYVYDNEDILLQYDGTSTSVSAGNNNLTASYIHGPGVDEPISVIARSPSGDEAIYYYHTDALGSVTAITDSNNNIVQSYQYDSFGNIVSQTGSLTQPYTFTGREYDPETGLYYYRARYYDPKIGRFLQEDPIWDVNLYGYVNNNPLNYVDPYGLFVFGKGPLGGLPWIPVASSNPIDNYLNTEISHEQGFFEDGFGENIGFGPKGRFSVNPTGKGYRYGDKHYDDDLMRQALKNLKDGKYSNWPWNKNNCQNWADRLRKEYERVKKEKEKEGKRTKCG